MSRSRRLVPLRLALAVVLAVGATACGSASDEPAPVVAQDPIAGPWGLQVGATIADTVVQEHADELEPAPEGPGQLRVTGTAFRLVPNGDGTYVIARDGLDRPPADDR